MVANFNSVPSDIVTGYLNQQIRLWELESLIRRLCAELRRGDGSERQREILIQDAEATLEGSSNDD